MQMSQMTKEYIRIQITLAISSSLNLSAMILKWEGLPGVIKVIVKGKEKIRVLALVKNTGIVV